jgi:endonuclease YncB( thermonuclease family)
MAHRPSISNIIISLVLVFFLFLLALLLKARYRLPSQEKAEQEVSVPKAIPVATPVEQKVAIPRAYKSGGFWVLPQPEFIVSRANEGDTFHIRSGPKEDIFVLYGVDSAQLTWTREKKVMEQATFFGGTSPHRVLDGGTRALAWVTKLLSENKFIVYTQWTRVPDTERYYAFVRVEIDGKQHDLGELLVHRGFAAPTGEPPKAMPEAGRTPENYKRELAKALSLAKAEQSGLWASQ